MSAAVLAIAMLALVGFLTWLAVRHESIFAGSMAVVLLGMFTLMNGVSS
jgi:hypothetical protein